ncbi:MAG: hypothetical protein ABI281_01070 [Caldimonas sp.]
MTARTWTLLAVVALTGCASKTSRETSTPGASPASIGAEAPVAAAASAPTRAAQRTAAASKLAVERQWLAAWFKGTPVVVAQRPDGAVVLEVPHEFCFEPGQDVVKPALASVLDKVARSLRRTAITELRLIAAPGDRGGAADLGIRRATRVYEFMRARGLPTGRLARPSTSSGTAVQLRIEAQSPA